MLFPAARLNEGEHGRWACCPRSTSSFLHPKLLRRKRRLLLVSELLCLKSLPGEPLLCLVVLLLQQHGLLKLLELLRRLQLLLELLNLLLEQESCW